MSLISRTLISLILCSTLGFTGLGQGTQSRKGTPEKKKRDAINEVLLTSDQQGALIALNRLFEAAKDFEDDLLRIRTQARIADMLWPYDEPRSRRQFEESFRATMSAETASSNSHSLSGGASPQISRLSELQSEVLSLVSRRDSDLAEKLIKSVLGDSQEKEAGTQVQVSAAQNTRYELYLQAAFGIIESDPGRAVQLAKASLGGGISPQIIKVLFALRSSNPAAADELFAAALAVARQESRRSSLNVATLAPYVLPEFTTMGAGSNSTHQVGAAAQGVSPLVREFLNFTYDTFLQLSGVAAQLGLPGANYGAAAPNPMDYMTGQRLLPSFIRYMPHKAATFRQAVDAIARNTQQVGSIDALSKVFQAGGTDELLDQAQTERNEHLRDLLYTRAVMAAMTGGDFDQALSIAEKLGDGDRRSSLDSMIRFQASLSALKKEDPALALRYAAGVADLRQRAYLYGTIARTLFDNNDVGRAVEVLIDAERDIEKASDDAVKANALLLIAEIRSRIDPARGFEAAEAAVKAFNRVDGTEQSAGRPSSPAGVAPNLSAILSSTLKLDAPNFEPVFLRLAKSDFNRAMQLARRLERNDRSVLAQLAVCQGTLTARQAKNERAVIERVK